MSNQLLIFLTLTIKSL